MTKPGNYIKFEPCTCGRNSRGMYEATDHKTYFACNGCGKTSIRYRADTMKEAKLGWNKYIQEIRQCQKTQENNLKRS